MQTRKRAFGDTMLARIPPTTQQEIRWVILYGFRRQLKPTQIFSECRHVYRANAPSLKTVSRWYGRFQTGYFSLEDELREDRPKASVDNRDVALM